MAERTSAGRFPKGVTGNPNGRPKGVANKITRAVTELIDDVLLGDVEATKARLIEMRDSGDPARERIFWTFCGRRVPMAIEATVEQTATVSIVRRYSSGKVVPLVAPRDIIDPVELPRP